jgi:SP family sugar:H+ symporter-like MFS transporter
MISFLTPLANDGISYAFGFVFVGTNLAAALLVWFFLYETRMLSLENVDLMYSQPDLKPWTSHRWVPPGYTTREMRTRDANGAGAAGRRFSDDTLQVGNGEKANGVKGVASNEERRETV